MQPPQSGSWASSVISMIAWVWFCKWGLEDYGEKTREETHYTSGKSRNILLVERRFFSWSISIESSAWISFSMSSLWRWAPSAWRKDCHERIIMKKGLSPPSSVIHEWYPSVCGKKDNKPRVVLSGLALQHPTSPWPQVPTAREKNDPAESITQRHWKDRYLHW